MTELRMESLTIPAADLGPENPLPMFRGEAEDVAVNVDGEVAEEERRHFGWRTGWRVLPYRMQDGYNRTKRPREFRAAVLENEILRATFLPELGGRLVSLLHKPAGRELLDRNPVFQPANLALRNAWFSGGIEWNAGLLGHHCRTCDPLFAARVAGDGGEPVLRLYEWDRVKGFLYQMDFHLPPQSPFLFARMRLINPHDRELPMYWWTNIAVPETPDARVLCPAESAFYGFGGKLSVARLPVVSGKDVTYTARVDHAGEFFFRIPPGQRPWVAHLDGQGRGLVHASTRRLKGRKMFNWGVNTGGRHWQEFLAVPGNAYLEIQAGLGRVQAESLPMPPHAQWTWTEAFGLLDADARRVHAEDWNQAWRAAESALDAQLPQSRLDDLDEQFATLTTRAGGEIVSRGSGWGALERRRQGTGFPEELIFDNLGEEQMPWLSLLEHGELPPADEPGSLMVQPEWRELLERALVAGRGDHWLAWWHLGNMRMEFHDRPGAREAWEQSLKRRRTGWALRNLAVAAGRETEGESGAPTWAIAAGLAATPDACDLLRQAWDCGPRSAALAIEYARVLLKLEQYQPLLEFAASLPAEFRRNDRIVLMTAQAALRTGRYEEVDAVFHQEFATVREGEVALTDLWFEFHERRIAAQENVPLDDALRQRVRREFPPPASIDFRMIQ